MVQEKVRTSPLLQNGGKIRSKSASRQRFLTYFASIKRGRIALSDEAE